jgi:hypothetical protein
MNPMEFARKKKMVTATPSDEIGEIVVQALS